ncbi:NAD(P)/FAD-dependent oxidoreductase [Babesia caballi]|uniref:NAD(P)/FAD-dependent oxidoreductase n=1 Tax=Babesia caballi TaxID=5871 RepID=A0AAV4LQ88_BABCB|nr:NAD(P)/FAD-dependent oxidoreductase [Babesia caballi]
MALDGHHQRHPEVPGQQREPADVVAVELHLVFVVLVYTNDLVERLPLVNLLDYTNVVGRVAAVGVQRVPELAQVTGLQDVAAVPNVQPRNRLHVEHAVRGDVGQALGEEQLRVAAVAGLR